MFARLASCFYRICYTREQQIQINLDILQQTLSTYTTNIDLSSLNTTPFILPGAAACTITQQDISAIERIRFNQVVTVDEKNKLLEIIGSISNQDNAGLKRITEGLPGYIQDYSVIAASASLVTEHITPDR